jgi:hypothetical protein
MEFEVKKVENCFNDSRTFEYLLPLDGHGFSALLAGWEVRENHKFRRPLFTADKDGVSIKGILKANVVKVSFPEDRWESEKAEFERWLTVSGGE